MQKNDNSTILVTGGAGFIGSWFVKKTIALGYNVIVLDKLTYSGSLNNLSVNLPPSNFFKGDICDEELVSDLLSKHRPQALINFAAESHVDNSISGPAPFVETNLVGTFNLLKNSLDYFNSLANEEKEKFRFIHISTDEVYGTLGPNDAPFNTSTPYAPNSPYSATKAGSDHLAKAWFETYKLPVIITNCSNNYGPFQHPEKLIPKTITKALAGEEIPVYSRGENIRDWIYVEDHCDGIILALQNGRPGDKYLFGGDSEMRNIDVVNLICDILQEKTGIDHKKQIRFVEDRPGHDFRYAIDSGASKQELGFFTKHNFEVGIRSTIDWYYHKLKNLKS